MLHLLQAVWHSQQHEQAHQERARHRLFEAGRVIKLSVLLTSYATIIKMSSYFTKRKYRSYTAHGIFCYFCTVCNTVKIMYVFLTVYSVRELTNFYSVQVTMMESLWMVLNGCLVMCAARLLVRCAAYATTTRFTWVVPSATCAVGSCRACPTSRIT